MSLMTVLMELLLVAAPTRDGPGPRAVGLHAELRAVLTVVERSPEADDSGEHYLRDREVRCIVHAAIARDGDATFEELRWLPRDLDGLRGSLIRALGTSKDPRALNWIVRQLEEPALIDDALQELVRFGRAIPGPLDSEARAHARGHLGSAHPNRRRLARAIAAALDDEAAVPVLVAQIDKADLCERRQISAALESITGARLGADEGIWERWLESELHWSAVHAARTLESVRSDDASVVVRALQELSGRGYQRARWSLAIAELLEGGRPLAVRQQACLALGRLRSRAARSALETARDSDPSELIRRLAAAALATS